MSNVFSSFLFALSPDVINALTPLPFCTKLRLSAPFVRTSIFAIAVFALQPLKFVTLFFHLSVPVPVLMPSFVTSRSTTANRPSNPNPSFIAPQIRLPLTILRDYKLYLLT